MEYRSTIYENGENLITRLGTFWYYIFGGREELKQFYRGSALEAGQTYLNFLETIGTISRLGSPVFHRQNWGYLTFLESEVETGVIRYGDAALYGEGYYYGVKADKKQYEIKLPDGVISAPVIFNKIINPSLTYVSGVDYYYDADKKSLIFNSNPFDSGLVPVRNIVDERGNVIDKRAALWMYNGLTDPQYLWNHWGYALKVFMPSSEFYKAFINALADCYTECPTLEAVQGLISSLVGVPMVIEPQETVEKVLINDSKRQVVTDRHVYTFKSNANILVSEGQVVYGGDTLTDAVTIIELNERLPTQAELPAMALGPEFISGNYFGDILLDNKQVPLRYLGVDGSDKAVVEFEVSGFPIDVTSFWAEVHANGASSGKVLSEYLDTRTIKNGPTPAWALPATVNPLQLLVGNLMRTNMFLVVLKPAQFNDRAPGIQFFSYLRRALSPQTTYLVYVEVDAGIEYIDLIGSAGIAEEQSFLQIPDDVSDDVLASEVSEAVMSMPIKDC